MDDGALEFVATLRDEASAAAARLKRTLGDLGGRVRGADIPLRVRDSASRGIALVHSSLRRLDGASRAVGRTLFSLGRSALLPLAAASGTAATAGLALGIKTAAGMETAQIAFETMLGSAGKAERFLGRLQAFAAKTPFEFPELQTAASSLISAGINANKVIPIMTTLGNVTSGMGTGSEGVQRATVALQQMAAAGRITGEDLNQLRDAGIPVFDLLASATNRTKAEVAALAQAGKLGGEDLAAMMNALETGKGLERFGGLMEKQSASLSGLWSTLKDTVSMSLAGMVTPAIPAIKRGLAVVSTSIQDAAVKVPAMIDKLKATSTVLRAFGPTSDNAARALSKLTGIDFSTIRKLQGVARDLGSVFTASVVPAFRSVSGVLPALLTPLGLLRSVLGFLTRHTTTAKVAFTVLFAALALGVPLLKAARAAAVVYSAAQTALAITTGRYATAEQLATRAKITSRLASVRGAAATAAHTVASVASAAASKAVAAGQLLVAGAMRVVNAVMGANPFVKVAMLLIALGTALVVAYRKSETFRNVVNGVFKAVQSAAGDAVGFLIDGFRGLLRVWLTVADGIISGAAKALGWIPGLGPKLKRANAAFDTMRAGIDRTLAGLANNARGWGEDVATGFAGGIKGSSWVAVAAAGNMAAQAEREARARLEAKSPSRVFMRIGGWISEGLAIGIRGGAAGVRSAVDDITSKLDRLVEAKAITKGKASRIVEWLKAESGELRRLASQREGIVARLEAARGRLSEARDARTALAGQTREAGLAFGTVATIAPDTAAIEAARSAQEAAAADLERLRGEEEQDLAAVAAATAVLTARTSELEAVEAREAMTAANVATKLDARRRELETFAASVATLRARGLNEASVQEIIAQGAEAGAASAAALAAGTDAQLAQINGIAASITATATAMGESTAGAMYDAGIRTAQGVVRGIESELDAVGTAARKIARRIIRTIRKELGIRSPSKVGAELGAAMPDGVAGGMIRNTRVAVSAAAKLSAAVTKAATPGVPNVPGMLPSMSVTASTGATVTIRHEVTSPDGSVSEMDAETIATLIARDPRAADALERSLAVRRSRRESAMIGASR